MHPKLESRGKSPRTAVVNVLAAAVPDTIGSICTIEIDGKVVLLEDTLAGVAAGMAGVTSALVFGPGLPAEGLKWTARTTVDVEGKEYASPAMRYALSRFVNCWRQVRNNNGIGQHLLLAHEAQVLRKMPKAVMSHWTTA